MAINLFKRKKPEQPAFSVLVICDNSGDSALINTALQDKGYTVHSMHTAIEALKLLDETGLPDVMIGDFVQPETDGKDFLEKVSIRFGKSAMPPILFLMDSKEDETAAAMLGVHDLLPKPFDGETLAQRVQQLIQRRLPAEE